MKIKIREAGKVRIIDLSGALDLGASAAVQAAARELLNDKIVSIADFNGVTGFDDSSHFSRMIRPVAE